MSAVVSQHGRSGSASSTGAWLLRLRGYRCGRCAGLRRCHALSSPVQAAAGPDRRHSATGWAEAGRDWRCWRRASGSPSGRRRDHRWVAPFRPCQSVSLLLLTVLPEPSLAGFSVLFVVEKMLATAWHRMLRLPSPHTLLSGRSGRPPGRSRTIRDFTLARARAEPLAPRQKEGVCAAAKRRPVGSRETG
jgi:hypothetical protein